MNFTGKNLAIVREALSLALDELHNQAATCPDAIMYADDLEEIEHKRIQVKNLLMRVNAKQPEGL